MMHRIFLHATCAILAWALLLGATAHAADQKKLDPRVEAYRKRPLAEKLASPRATLETFCFAVDAYQRVPSMIDEAVACLEIDARDGFDAGAGELLALQLDEILNEIVPAIRLVPGKLEDKTFVLWQNQAERITLARDEHGLWRFDRATVLRLPQLQRLMISQSKSRLAARAKLSEGMEDPTATMISFLDYASAGDYMSAALRLDLSDLPIKERRARGHYLAWKLACVIQRRGYVFQEEVPIDPDGPPYTWSANRNGRIAVERISQPGSKDAWQFTRGTVASIENMWRAERDKLPDVRYAVVDRVVPPPPATSDDAGQSSQFSRPASVPEDFSSPRRLLRGFLAAMDDSEVDDAKQEKAYSYLDLSQFPAEDIPVLGPKRADMLWAVLRKLRPDLNGLPERWSSPPQTLMGAPNLRVQIVRQPDGCWRFSGETVAQLPAMYAHLEGRDKAEDVRLHGLSNPREALVTFLMAIDDDNDVDAARSLDLSDYPASARADIGPVLAFKIKYILDRTLRLFLAEIPSEPDGPQVVLYRGPHGRLVLGLHEEGGQKIWGFTALTVRHAEEMFTRLMNQPIVPDLPNAARSEPDFSMEPGIWLRVHLPAWAQRQHILLEDYQWLGMVLLLGLAWGCSVLVRLAAEAVLRWELGTGKRDIDRHLLRTKLRSLQALVFLLISYFLLEALDLSAMIAARIYVIQKLLLALVLTWTALQWADLARMLYENTERFKHHRGLGDLIVPFTLNAVKLSVILGAAGFLLYQFGKAEALTRFFAGVGIVGLAVSLAAQDSLKNLFGSLLLIGDRSFRIGDRLIVNGQEGVVEQVGFRSTKLRTVEDSLLVLPNGLLANGVIDNLGLRVFRRVCLLFSLAITTPLDRAVALRDAVETYVKAHPLADLKRVHVYIQKIGETGIELEISAYFVARDLETENQLREQLTCEVMRLAGSLQVELRGTKN